MSEKKVSILAIAVKDRLQAAPQVNALLSRYGDQIVARIGIPKNGLNLISVIIETTEDEIDSITGKLKTIDNVQVKTLTV